MADDNSTVSGSGETREFTLGGHRFSTATGTISMGSGTDGAIVVPIYPTGPSGNLRNYQLTGDSPEITALRARIAASGELRPGGVWMAPAEAGRPRVIFAVTFGSGANEASVRSAVADALVAARNAKIRNVDFAVLDGGFARDEGRILSEEISARAMQGGMEDFARTNPGGRSINARIVQYEGGDPVARSRFAAGFAASAEASPAASRTRTAEEPPPPPPERPGAHITLRNPGQDFYDVLDVDRTSPTLEADIKQNYRRLTMALHADHNPGDELVRIRFNTVQDAYRVLKDTTLRSEYDAALLRNAGARSPHEAALAEVARNQRVSNNAQRINAEDPRRAPLNAGRIPADADGPPRAQRTAAPEPEPEPQPARPAADPEPEPARAASGRGGRGPNEPPPPGGRRAGPFFTPEGETAMARAARLGGLGHGSGAALGIYGLYAGEEQYESDLQQGGEVADAARNLHNAQIAAIVVDGTGVIVNARAALRARPMPTTAPVVRPASPSASAAAPEPAPVRTLPRGTPQEPPAAAARPAARTPAPAEPAARPPARAPRGGPGGSTGETADSATRGATRELTREVTREAGSDTARSAGRTLLRAAPGAEVGVAEGLAAGVLRRAALPVAVGLTALDVRAGYVSGDGYRIARAGGAMVGGIAGGVGGSILAAGAVGAIAGSEVPILGNAIGFVVGCGVGAVSAYFAGRAAESALGDRIQRMFETQRTQVLAPALAVTQQVEQELAAGHQLSPAQFAQIRAADARFTQELQAVQRVGGIEGHDQAKQASIRDINAVLGRLHHIEQVYGQQQAAVAAAAAPAPARAPATPAPVRPRTRNNDTPTADVPPPPPPPPADTATPAPGTPAPGTPAPGTPAPGTPAPDTPAPDTSTPGTSRYTFNQSTQDVQALLVDTLGARLIGTNSGKDGLAGDSTRRALTYYLGQMGVDANQFPAGEAGTQQMAAAFKQKWEQTPQAQRDQLAALHYDATGASTPAPGTPAPGTPITGAVPPGTGPVTGSVVAGTFVSSERIPLATLLSSLDDALVRQPGSSDQQAASLSQRLFDSIPESARAGIAAQLQRIAGSIQLGNASVTTGLSDGTLTKGDFDEILSYLSKHPGALPQGVDMRTLEHETTEQALGHLQSAGTRIPVRPASDRSNTPN